MYVCMYMYGLVTTGHQHTDWHVACMYECMFVCMYVRMYVCMYLCMSLWWRVISILTGMLYVCMNVCLCVCMNVWMYAWLCDDTASAFWLTCCMYVCMYVRTYICMYVYMYVYVACWWHIISTQMDMFALSVSIRMYVWHAYIYMHTSIYNEYLSYMRTAHEFTIGWRYLVSFYLLSV
jgi:hypothetical protein